MVTASGAVTALRVIGAIVVASWVVLFAGLICMLVLVTVLRGRRQRQRGGATQATPADPRLPAQLAEVRAGDPHFDEQLLLGAAQMVCLVMFAAMSTGDDRAIRRLTEPSFWSTFFGRYLLSTTREARLQRKTADSFARGSRQQARLPVDYQASAPQLIGLEPGPRQRAAVRVSFSQLRAVLGADAQGQAAMASADSLTSLATSFSGAMRGRMDGIAELSWVSWAGQYDLGFSRPAGARTEQGTALASRACAACGATYRSELAIECAHCRAERPVPWGQWRLASITAVE
jgi:hypothetical protein